MNIAPETLPVCGLSSVLLIEDSPADARLVREHLADHYGDACVLHVVDCLTDGLARLGAVPIDAVLLDLGLPDSDGLDALSRLHASAPQVPVVVLTGARDPRQGREAVRLGAEDYLPKHDASPAVLIRALEHAVSRARRDDPLRDGPTRYRTLFETAEEAIVWIDEAGTIETVNRRAVQLTGRAAIELVGRPLADLVPQDRFRFELVDLASTPPGTRRVHALGIERCGGLRRRVTAAAGAMVAARDQRIDRVVMLTDDTDRARAEATLALTLAAVIDAESTYVALAEARDAAGVVADSLGRDVAPLATALHTAVAAARAGRTASAAELERRTWDAMDRIAGALVHRVDGLRSLADVGRSCPGRDQVDLSAIARRRADALAVSAPRRDTRFELTPGVTACGDAALLERLVGSLLDEAWARTAGTPRASIRFEASVAPSGETVYAVEHTGPGFDSALAAPSFRPFDPGSVPGDPASRGIALALAHRIVAVHRGTLWLRSTRAGPTTTCFTLGRAAGSGAGANDRTAQR